MIQQKILRKTVLEAWKTGAKERTIKIKGTSMKPFIMEGYTVTISPLPSLKGLMIGDIALFARDTALVAHRIIDRYFTPKGVSFKEKGDNNFYPGTVSGTDIIGKVIRIDSGTFTIDLAQWYWRFINLLLGYYWKILFSLLAYIQEAKYKLFGQQKLYGINVIFQKIVHFLIKLPHFIFRLK